MNPEHQVHVARVSLLRLEFLLTRYGAHSALRSVEERARAAFEIGPNAIHERRVRWGFGRVAQTESIGAHEVFVDAVGLLLPSAFAKGQLDRNAEAYQVDDRRTGGRIVEVGQAEALRGHSNLFEVRVAVQVYGWKRWHDRLETPAHFTCKSGVNESKVAMRTLANALHQLLVRPSR